jgi:RES domain
MTGFESWEQYSEFSRFVMGKFRHILAAKNQRFLDVVVDTSQKRRRTIKKGKVLWRAQLGHDWHAEILRDEDGNEFDSIEVECPFEPERMIPLPDRASEGRVNPKGIPCLYFSSNMEMAITETRPWIGSLVSVAHFVMLKDLTVVDCSADSAEWGSSVWFEKKEQADEDWDLVIKEPNPEEWENLVWGDIN